MATSLASFFLTPHLTDEDILLTLPSEQMQSLMISPLPSSWARPPLFLTKIIKLDCERFSLPSPFSYLADSPQHNTDQIPSFISQNPPVLPVSDQQCLPPSSPTPLSFPDCALARLAFLLFLLPARRTPMSGPSPWFSPSLECLSPSWPYRSLVNHLLCFA